MSAKLFVSTLVLALPLLPAAATNREVPVYAVDCDAGGDLARVLRQLPDVPGIRIDVRGTCVGYFVVTTDHVELRGTSPTQSQLVAPQFDTSRAVLEVRDSTGVVLRNLTVRGGGVGVVFRRSPGGTVIDGVFTSNEAGLHFEQSLEGTLQDCDIHHNDVGLVVWNRSAVSTTGVTIRDSVREGVAVFGHSTFYMNGSEVRDNNRSGIEMRNVSEVRVSGSSFADNGGVHLYADDRSRIDVLAGVALGDEGDTTQAAIVVDGHSVLSSFAVNTYFGDILAQGGSLVELGGVDVRGAVRGEEFARVLLAGTQLALAAECRTGGDLVCTSATTAATVGCPSAVASCTTPPGVEPRGQR